MSYKVKLRGIEVECETVKEVTDLVIQEEACLLSPPTRVPDAYGYIDPHPRFKTKTDRDEAIIMHSKLYPEWKAKKLARKLHTTAAIVYTVKCRARKEGKLELGSQCKSRAAVL
jgi:hypothetical protein